MSMGHRRSAVRVLALPILFVLVLTIAAFVAVDQTRATAADRFGFADVVGRAKTLSGEPFKAPPAVPDLLTRLPYDAYRKIWFDAAQSLWRGTGASFRVHFLHPGFIYRQGVTVNVLEGGHARKVPFSPALFHYDDAKLAEKIPPDVGFAGFAVAAPLYRKTEYEQVLVFAGASYFRGRAKNEVFGISARGLAVDTAMASGEEFPIFREFWLEQPARGATAMTIYALLDSQRVTGAYEFILRTGARTQVDVKAVLFERQQVKELGVAPLTSMFFYGEERARPAGDWRPEVHDSDGLLVHAGTGEWIWRPLFNPERLQVSYFELQDPRGFGLLQRDRSFHAYEDLESRYERRPNAWVTPVGDWGKGQIKLVLIPSQNETNDNVVAYWLPASRPAAGRPIEVAYRIHFQEDDPAAAVTGRAMATRLGDGDNDTSRRIIIDFAGGKLNDLPASAPVKPVLTAGEPNAIVQQSIVKNPVTGGWRLAFQVKPPKGKPLELRAFLQHNGNALTETWSYLLAP